MTNRPEALALLRRLLADEEAEFRDGQWDAVDALVNRRERLLLVQRTGWGKSSVYFVATRMLRAIISTAFSRLKVESGRGRSCWWTTSWIRIGR